MKLEQQVSNLELSKRLKELGVKQESHFWWVRTAPNGEFYLRYKLPTEFMQLTEYSAFTVAELGSLGMIDSNVYWQVYYNPTQKIWMVNTRDVMFDGYKWQFTADTEADCRAKMVIYLKEKK